MPPFPILFQGQLPGPGTFEATYTRQLVVEFLQNVRDQPATYGLTNEATTVLTAFFNADTGVLLDVIAATVDAAGLPIRDVGSAVGYLFSQLPAPTVQADGYPNYLPTLAVFSRLMKLIDPYTTMSATMLDPTSGAYLFGSTIPVWRGNRGLQRTRVQEARREQLRLALVGAGLALPVLPRMILQELAKYLADVYVPTQATGARRPDLATPQKLALYATAITTFIETLSATRPLTCTFYNDLTAYNEAVQNIVNDEGPWDAALVSASLQPDVLTPVLQEALRTSTSSLFGHCAETWPFVHLLRRNAAGPRQQSQGLSMRIVEMNDIDPALIIANGTRELDRPLVFRYPCGNCTQLAELIGMDIGVFNSYINNVVRPTFDPDVS